MKASGIRIAQVDVLRGAALFGILVVNILVFAFSNYGGTTGDASSSVLSKGLATGISALFELKFYLLFSFLFGYSFTLQERSALRAGQPPGPRLIRRHATLFGIGLLHAVILFHGDILTTYAMLGLVLGVLGHTRTKVRLTLAITLLLSASAVWLLLAWLQWQAPARDDSLLLLAHVEQAKEAYTSTPRQIVRQHVRDLADFLPLLLLLQAPCALAMLLLGQLAGDRELFADPLKYRKIERHLVVGAIFVGLPGALVYALATRLAPGSSMETAALAASILSGPFLAGGLMVVVMRLLANRSCDWLTQRMAAAGRMSLTNYLMQSLVCALLFHGYGLGLMDGMTLPAVLAVAVVIYTAQLIASPIWLNHQCYGPMEWLLRAATLLRWPAWKRSPQALNTIPDDATQ